MGSIDYRSGVAIGVLVVYLPALAIAILLAIRHGFGRSSGWLFLNIFSLIRIVGSCFQLATINNPTDSSLYIGVSILQSVGLSPLELASLGLLSRVISSINKNQPTLVGPRHIKLIQLVVMVGLILGIVGGVDAADTLTSTGKYVPQTLSKVSVGLFIASFAILTLCVALTALHISHAEAGEKRILLAIALSLPFLLVRVIYSAISIFANTSSFNNLTGNVTIYLCMAILMELAVVIIYEGVGITLRRLDPVTQPRAVGQNGRNGPAGAGYVETADAPGYEQPQRVQEPSKGSQFASTLGRRTIIGRLITSAMGSGNNNTRDTEMQNGQYSGGRHTRRQERRAQRQGRY